MDRGEVLETATQIITKERVEVHGTPENSFGDIAEVWNWFLGDALKRPLESWEVSLMMTLFKIARAKNQPDHVDNFVDGIGYLAIAVELFEATHNAEMTDEHPLTELNGSLEPFQPLPTVRPGDIDYESELDH